MLDTNQQDDREFAALVGIDWADQKHAWALHSFNASERSFCFARHTARSATKSGASIS